MHRIMKADKKKGWDNLSNIITNVKYELVIDTYQSLDSSVPDGGFDGEINPCDTLDLAGALFRDFQMYFWVYIDYRVTNDYTL